MNTPALYSAFIRLLNRSIAAGILAAVILLLRPFLKRAPRRYLCLLWAVVALRLVCTLSIPSQVSAFRVLHTGTDPRGAAAFVTSQVQAGTPVLRLEVPQSAQEPVSAAAMVTGVRSGFPLGWAASLWLAGVAGMLGYGLVRSCRLRRQTSASLRREDGVCVCDDIPAAFILGILRPRIFLCSGLEEAVQPHVLAHERAHLRRGDHLWKPLGYFLLALHWFNPLLWLAYFRFLQDTEEACDEAVTQDFSSVQRAEYARALLVCAQNRRRVSVLPVAFGENAVAVRIKKVLSGRKPAFAAAAAAVLACMAAAVCFLTDPQAVPQSAAYTQRSALIYSQSRGKTVLSEQADARIAPDGSARLALALVIAENHDPDETVQADPLLLHQRFPQDALYNTKEGRQRFKNASVRDLLAGMLLGNMRDAAYVLAVWDAGSEEAMVEKLNTYTAALCSSTHYTDLFGQAEGQYTTAADVCILTGRLLADPTLCQLWQTAEYTSPWTEAAGLERIPNANYLYNSTVLPRFRDPSVTGGFAWALGRASIVCTAQKNGEDYICILLGAERILEDNGWQVQRWGNLEEMAELLTRLE